MIIKIVRSLKDDLEKCTSGRYINRREFIEKGIITSTLAVTLPKILMNDIVKNAMGADMPTCPPSVRNATGSLTTVYAQGGMTVGAYFQSEIEMSCASGSANAANRYGVIQTGFTKLGQNLYMNEASYFAAAVRQVGIDLGYSAAQWDFLLKKCNGGFHCGPFNQDDQNGQNRGYNVAISGTMRPSSLNKSIAFNSGSTFNASSIGVAVSKLNGGNVNPTAMAALYSLTPAGQINANIMNNAATTANNLGGIFKSILGLDTRSGGSEVLTNATCGFIGDVPLTDPNYGKTLFDPTVIAALSGRLNTATNPNAGNITAEERAWLSACYNGDIGVTSGCNIEMGGFDYHNQTPQTIAGQVRRFARAFGMWLAAADAAKTKACFAGMSNGQAMATGVTSATVNGITGNVQNANGDAGGAHNKAFMIVVDCTTPGATAPNMRTIGAFDTTNGNSSSTLGDALAMKGLIASAFEFLAGTVTNQQFGLLGTTALEYKSSGLIHG